MSVLLFFLLFCFKIVRCVTHQWASVSRLYWNFYLSCLLLNKCEIYEVGRTHTRGVARGGAPRNLADQLTLFKPGGQIMPLTLLPAPPRIQKAIYISELERLKTLESQILSLLHHMLLLLLETADYWFQLVTNVMFC